MLMEKTVTQLADIVASKEPVPGGGSISALAGSLAAALTAMVARLTEGRKGFEAVSEQMTDIIAKADTLRQTLAEAVDQDADAYHQVMAAYRLPRQSEAEKTQRREAIEQALKGACQVPLKTARAAAEVMALADTVVRHGNPNAVTDGAVGAMMARSAVLGAVYNVRINLDGITDSAFVAQMRAAVDALNNEAIDRERQILAVVKLG